MSHLTFQLPVATPSQSLGPVPSGPEVITIVDSSEEEDDDVISLPASSTTAAVGSGDRASEAVACPLCEDRDGFDPKIPANYPLKTIKKAVRQETVVAVNILSTSDTGAALVLLVKRGADQGVSTYPLECSPVPGTPAGLHVADTYLCIECC